MHLSSRLAVPRAEPYENRAVPRAVLHASSAAPRAEPLRRAEGRAIGVPSPGGRMSCSVPRPSLGAVPRALLVWSCRVRASCRAASRAVGRAASRAAQATDTTRRVKPSRRKVFMHEYQHYGPFMGGFAGNLPGEGRGRARSQRAPAVKPYKNAGGRATFPNAAAKWRRVGARALLYTCIVSSIYSPLPMARRPWFGPGYRRELVEQAHTLGQSTSLRRGPGE